MRRFSHQYLPGLIAAAIVFQIVSPAGADDATATTTHRLMRAMGVIPMARIAPPVDITLADLDGQTVSLAELRGKVVFLNFWATWCPDCRIEMPALEKLAARFKGRDFAMLAVDLREPASRVKAFARKYKLTFPILLDSRGKTALHYGIRSIPTTFILNRNGALIGRALGSRRWDSPASVDLFEQLLAAEPFKS